MDQISGPVERALEDALDDAAGDIEARDEAAVALAKRYAALIDTSDADLVPKLGAQLLAVLEQLRMTPKARQAVMKGGTAGDGGTSKRAALIALRNEHDARPGANNS